MEQLKKLHYENWRRYSTAPDYTYPRPTYSDKTANSLTKCIVDFLNFSGYQAERISSEGKVIDKRKTYTDVIGRVVTIGGVQRTYSTTTNGTADISATIMGRSVKIEVKIGRDRQSETQKRYQEAIERAGGIYYIARNFESFYDWFIETFKSTEGLKYG
jgi:hypothetical protein